MKRNRPSAFASLLALTWATTALAAAPPTTRPAAPTVSPRQAAADARALLDRNNAAAPPTWSVEYGRPRKVEASLAFVASAPRMAPKQWTIVAPLPPTLDAQRDVAADTTPKAVTAAEPAPPGRGYLLWQIPAADGAPRHVAVGVKYTLALVPRALVERPPARPPAPLAADERARFTAPGPLADFEAPAFQTWLIEHALRPAAKETDLAFARRAFLEIKESAGFEFKERMDRRASAVCKGMKSDCGGLTALFVAAMRASGVPARQLVGRWAESAEKDEKLEGREWQKEHVKAEFYAAGIGWVPADLSVAVDFDRRPGSLRHFGRDNADFVVLHVDPDIRPDPPGGGRRTLMFFQEPVFFVTGQGTMERAQTKFDWQVGPAGK